MKNILIFDNYDSFTGNLYHLLHRVRPGYSYRILRNRDNSVLGTPWDGVVISPGPGEPLRDTGLLPVLFREVIEPRSLPCLGICLGMQFLAAFYGLDVRPAEDAVHGRRVPVEHGGTGLFKGLPRPFMAMRYNSLCVAEGEKAIKDTPLAVTAVQQGSRSIMGLSHESAPFHGVQFHPESFLSEGSCELMDNFFRESVDD